MGRGRRDLQKGSCEREQNLWAGQSMLRGGALWSWWGDYLVHEAFWIEQRGPRDGVHLQRVASVGKQELRKERGPVNRRSG